MTVDELAAEQHPGKAVPDALFVFVNALPIPGGFGFGGMSNECVRLEVAGDGYNVRAAQRSDVIAEAGNDTATFRPYRVVTSIESDAEPRYWAVPLLNFTSYSRRLGHAAHHEPPFVLSDLNAARTSSEKSSGSSQAAKWPPLSGSLK